MKQRKDGRYCVKYHGMCFYGKTQREAKSKVDQYKIDEANGTLLKGRQTFRSYAAIWLPIYRKNAGNKQYNQYVYMLNDAADWLGDPWIDTITPTAIKDLYNHLDGMSESHIKKYASLIRGVMRAAVADGYAKRDPTIDIKRPSGTAGTHRALEDWEDDLVLRLQDHRMGPAVMVMRYAGLRRGEACYLDIDRDVDFTNHTIHVRGGLAWDDGNTPNITGGKSDAAIRTIPMNEILEQCLMGRHGLLISQIDGSILTLSSFKGAWESWKATFEQEVNGHKRGYWERMKQKAEAEGRADSFQEWIPCTIRTHDFRHSYCSDLYAAGVDLKTAMRWMGHGDMAMLLEIYTHLKEKTEIAATQKLNELIKSRKCHNPTPEN